MHIGGGQVVIMVVVMMRMPMVMIRIRRKGTDRLLTFSRHPFLMLALELM